MVFSAVLFTHAFARACTSPVRMNFSQFALRTIVLAKGRWFSYLTHSVCRLRAVPCIARWSRLHCTNRISFSLFTAKFLNKFALPFSFQLSVGLRRFVIAVLGDGKHLHLLIRLEKWRCVRFGLSGFVSSLHSQFYRRTSYRTPDFAIKRGASDSWWTEPIVSYLLVLRSSSWQIYPHHLTYISLRRTESPHIHLIVQA